MCQLFDFETLDIQSLFFGGFFAFASRCLRWRAGSFLEQSCLLYNNITSDLEAFDLETEIAQYYLKQHSIY